MSHNQQICWASYEPFNIYHAYHHVGYFQALEVDKLIISLCRFHVFLFLSSFDSETENGCSIICQSEFLRNRCKSIFATFPSKSDKQQTTNEIGFVINFRYVTWLIYSTFLKIEIGIEQNNCPKNCVQFKICWEISKQDQSGIGWKLEFVLQRS